MNISFFDVEDWMEEPIRKAFPDANLFPEHIDQAAAKTQSETDVIVGFVTSEFSAEILVEMPNLKLIATNSTGFDHIDLEYCNKNGILVANVPEYGSRTVAEYTFALMLDITRKIYQGIQRTKQGSFLTKGLKGIDVYEKTLGIVGLGKIGLEVHKIARAFGMNVLVHTRTHDEELAGEHGFTYAKDFNDLLSKSDIISFHVPLTKETENMLNCDNLSLCKKGCYIVNTARGGLIETKAILEGLQSGQIEAVALDVLEEEHDLREEMEIITTQFRKKDIYQTLVMDHMLVHHPKVIVTPHNAFNSAEARNRIIQTTIENIQSYEKSEPVNIVNAPLKAKKHSRKKDTRDSIVSVKNKLKSLSS